MVIQSTVYSHTFEAPTWSSRGGAEYDRETGNGSHHHQQFTSATYHKYNLNFCFKILADAHELSGI